MDQFAQMLRQIAGSYIRCSGPKPDRPVGLLGFRHAFTPFQVLPRAGSDGVTVFAMIEQQLGLKLEQG